MRPALSDLGTSFSAHLTTGFGRAGLTFYIAAAILLLQRGVEAPVLVLALAALWRWGFLLGVTSAIHSAIGPGELVAAAVTLVGSLLAGMGTIAAFRSGR